MSYFPGQDLIKSLDELRKKLSSSGVERTIGLLDELGDDCSYYRKSLDIFLKRDYDEIRKLINKSKEIMDNLGEEG